MNSSVIYLITTVLGPQNTRSAKVWCMSVNAPGKPGIFIVRDPIWIGIPNALSIKNQQREIFQPVFLKPKKKKRKKEKSFTLKKKCQMQKVFQLFKAPSAITLMSSCLVGSLFLCWFSRVVPFNT